MIRRAALVAAIVVVACGVAPFDALHLAPLPHTPDVRRWWGEVERCTGRTGDLAPIRLTLWADTTLLVANGQLLDGAYLHDQRLIVLRRYDPRIIRHEMVHALLAPDTSHPAWVGVACGSILRWP